jgi:plastocyanin
MRRSFVVGVVTVTALTLIALGGAAFAATTRATPPTKTVTIAPTNCAGGQFFCYKPAPLTVKRGTKIIWKNATKSPHSVTRCTAAMCGVSGGTGKQTGLKSPTIHAGRTYAFTFRQPGTYRYLCNIHGYAAMHGTITVR